MYIHTHLRHDVKQFFFIIPVDDITAVSLSLSSHLSPSLFRSISRRVTYRLVNVKGKRTARIATTSFQNGFFFFYFLLVPR